MTLRLILGFLVQIVPCAFFCFYPFLNRTKYKKKTIILTVSGILLVYLPLFVAGYLPFRASLTGNIAANGIFFSCILVLLIYYIRTVQAVPFQKLFVFLLVLHFGLFVSVLSNLIDPVLQRFYPSPTTELYELYSPKSLIFILTATLIISPFFMVLLRRLGHSMAKNLDNALWGKLCLIPGAFFFLVGISLILAVNYMSNEELSRWYVCLLIIAPLVYQFFIYWGIIQAVDYSFNTAMLRLRHQKTLASYHSIRQAIDDTRRARHELKHYITVLKTLYHSGDMASLKRRLDELDEHSSHLPPLNYSLHPLVNSLLTDCAAKAGALHIATDFRIALPESFVMPEMDLCCLLSNILDNALEACQRIPDGESRYIHLTMYLKGYFLFLSCENSSPGRPEALSGGRFRTSKADGTSHGYGLEIIQKIAKYYNSPVQIDAQDHSFGIIVNLCLDSGKNPKRSGVFPDL